MQDKQESHNFGSCQLLSVVTFPCSWLCCYVHLYVCLVCVLCVRFRDRVNDLTRKTNMTNKTLTLPK